MGGILASWVDCYHPVVLLQDLVLSLGLGVAGDQESGKGGYRKFLCRV